MDLPVAKERIHQIEPSYRGLYRYAAAAALLAALVFRRNLDAEWMLLRMTGVVRFGPAGAPASMADWFSLLQQHPVLGLTLLNMFDLVNYVLVGVILLALALVMRKTNPSAMVIAAALGLAGAVLYLASNQAFAMLSLSQQYADAIGDLQRSQILAAGQTILAVHQSAASFVGPGIYPGYLLVSTAGLIVSITMLSSTFLSRRTAITGILANGFQLSYYVVLAVMPAFVAVPISISAIFLLVWYLQVGIRLYQLSSLKTGHLDYSTV